MLTETDIERIARRVAAAYRPVAVGIFGSYATGEATARSDLDLFVITDPSGAVPLDARAVRRLLFDILHPLDIQVFGPTEFEESAGDHQSFTWVIARQARLLHWAREADRAVPSLLPRAIASEHGTTGPVVSRDQAAVGDKDDRPLPTEPCPPSG